jgi:hypothetical protein
MENIPDHDKGGPFEFHQQLILRVTPPIKVWRRSAVVQFLSILFGSSASMVIAGKLKATNRPAGCNFIL